jgi:hypothetical protein
LKNFLRIQVLRIFFLEPRVDCQSYQTNASINNSDVFRNSLVFIQVDVNSLEQHSIRHQLKNKGDVIPLLTRIKEVDRLMEFESTTAASFLGCSLLSI